MKASSWAAPAVSRSPAIEITVTRVPGGHAVAEGDVVEGHIGIFVPAHPAETLLALGQEAQGRAFGAVGEDAEMPRCRDAA
jgi:hypothetical protein